MPRRRALLLGSASLALGTVDRPTLTVAPSRRVPVLWHPKPGDRITYGRETFFVQEVLSESTVTLADKPPFPFKRDVP
jgi:hypothetical protein